MRTDNTVSEVWYNIQDAESENDDGDTGIDNGNNAWVKAVSVTPGLELENEYPREWRFTYRNIPSGNLPATLQVRLVELTSSDDFDLTDEAGHYTTLSRNVITNGPEQKLFVAWPQQDGDQVGEGYSFKAYFSKVLADGTNTPQLIDRFVLRINGQAQGKESYSIVYDETTDYHALAFTLPQLFNGDPEFRHLIEVEHTTPAELVLTASREVLAVPVEPGPELIIVKPEQFDSNGRQTEIVLPDVAVPDPRDREYEIQVTTSLDIETVTLEFVELFGGSVSASPVEVQDSQKLWRFVWTIQQPATYVFTARGFISGTQVASNLRSIPVLFRQLVSPDTSGDSDDDGIPDLLEVENEPLPDSNSEFWTNGDVHIHRITGRTNPLMPLTDGGGLPDGLQSGLIGPLDPAATDRAVDTNGDGFTNFISDLDPPIFNTKADNSGRPGYIENRGRTDQMGGSMTDPARPDTDSDGLRDSEEDLNRNGRVDIGLVDGGGKVSSLLEHPDIPTVYNSSRVDREALPANAVFLETDPNTFDTVGDGLSDGQADVNRNGRVDMFLLDASDTLTELEYTDSDSPYFAYNRMPNVPSVLQWDNTNPPDWHVEGTDYAAIRSRAVHYDALLAAYTADGTGSEQIGGWPKLLITETDPLVMDTVGDGLPDGWKVRYGLDPLDDGSYNWRTGESGNPLNGPTGDLTGDGFTNLDHFINGTDPRIAITGVPPPEDSIVLGAGEEIGVVKGMTRYEEFTDWTWEDLRALDAYEGGGSNHQNGDLFPGYDGWDASRDLVAFYTRDGGASAQGGDDRMYFRIDFHDLQAFAEQENLDLYVAVNFGDTIGERVLPDEVDTLTDMRWRTVVALYASTAGTVYVDTDSVNNTTSFGQDLSANGVVSRGDYFLGAYYNSELDAVEFAVNRQALLDAGWLGTNPADLRFQVYSTKSGTGNSPQGGGDVGGRSDIRDSIYNDYIAEDHWS
ncbi:MAG: hypothetical protein PF795_05580, partial [Kiritimatiellae bacterium]|nr:hypothetical protein [Kiritimatiellia bacterium]